MSIEIERTEGRPVVLPTGKVLGMYTISRDGDVTSWVRPKFPKPVKSTRLPSGNRRIWLYVEGERRGYMVGDLVRSTWS